MGTVTVSATSTDTGTVSVSEAGGIYIRFIYFPIHWNSQGQSYYNSPSYEINPECSVYEEDTMMAF